MSVFFEAKDGKWSEMIGELEKWLGDSDVKFVDTCTNLTGHEVQFIRCAVGRVSKGGEVTEMRGDFLYVDFGGEDFGCTCWIRKSLFEDYEVEEDLFKVIMKDRIVFNFVVR